MAAVMKLPLVLIIENNQFAYSTPSRKQYAAARLSDRAAGYGIPGVTIDGTDVVVVFTTCRAAVERARRGEGPTLIESVTMRMHGHSASDDASYVPKALLDEWSRKDPLEAFERKLKSEGVLDEAAIAAMTEKIEAAIDEGLAFALAQPPPPAGDAAEGVYAP